MRAELSLSMKLSEYINGLIELLAKNGDADIMYEYGTFASLPAFNSDDPTYLLTFEEVENESKIRNHLTTLINMVISVDNLPPALLKEINEQKARGPNS